MAVSGVPSTPPTIPKQMPTECCITSAKNYCGAKTASLGTFHTNETRGRGMRLIIRTMTTDTDSSFSTEIRLEGVSEVFLSTEQRRKSGAGELELLLNNSITLSLGTGIR